MIITNNISVAMRSFAILCLFLQLSLSLLSSFPVALRRSLLDVQEYGG